jgi:hypothetical protein
MLILRYSGTTKTAFIQIARDVCPGALKVVKASPAAKVSSSAMARIGSGIGKSGCKLLNGSTSPHSTSNSLRNCFIYGEPGAALETLIMKDQLIFFVVDHRSQSSALTRRRRISISMK